MKLPLLTQGVSSVSKSQLRLILPSAQLIRKLRFLALGFSFIPGLKLRVFCKVVNKNTPAFLAGVLFLLIT